MFGETGFGAGQEALDHHSLVKATPASCRVAVAASRAAVSMKGLMQDYPLVVSSILDYAAKFHAEQEVISRTVEGGTHRYTYADMHKRAQLCSLAFHKLGVRQVDLQDLPAL